MPAGVSPRVAVNGMRGRGSGGSFGLAYPGPH
jgi:hypothetical protein